MNSAQPKSLDTGPGPASSATTPAQAAPIGIVRQYQGTAMPMPAATPFCLPSIPRATASVIPMGSYMDNKIPGAGVGGAGTSLTLQNLHQQAFVRQLHNQTLMMQAAAGLKSVPVASGAGVIGGSPATHIVRQTVTQGPRPIQLKTQPGTTLAPRPHHTLTPQRVPLVTQGLGGMAQRPMGVTQHGITKTVQQTKVHLTSTAAMPVAQKLPPRPLQQTTPLGAKPLTVPGQKALEQVMQDHARSGQGVSSASTIQISVQPSRTSATAQLLHQPKVNKPLGTGTIPSIQGLTQQQNKQLFYTTGGTPITLSAQRQGTTSIPTAQAVIRQQSRPMMGTSGQVLRTQGTELPRMATTKTVVQTFNQPSQISNTRPGFPPKVAATNISLPNRNMTPINTAQLNQPLAKVRPSPQQVTIHSAPIQAAAITHSIQPRLGQMGQVSGDPTHHRLLQMLYQQQQHNQQNQQHQLAAAVAQRPIAQPRPVVMEPSQPTISQVVNDVITHSAAALHSTGGGLIPGIITTATASSSQSGVGVSTTGPLQQPNASPLRPSILRKRNHEGVTVARRSIIGYPSSNETSRTESVASGQIPASPVKNIDQENSQSSTDTASSTHSTPLKQQVENGHLELSPRKKPRKQLMPPASIEEPQRSDHESEEEEEGDGEGREAEGGEAKRAFAMDTFKRFISRVHEIREAEKEGEERKEEAPEAKMPEEYVDDDGHRWVRDKNMNDIPKLLQSYYVNWKARNNHFLRYQDIKIKEERKSTVNELSNQKNMQQKICGWKLYHLAAQLDELKHVEEQTIKVLTEVQDVIAPKSAAKATMEDVISMVHEVSQGNIQRCRVFMDQIQEVKTSMLGILDHKQRVEQVISKHYSKRHVKKKERN